MKKILFIISIFGNRHTSMLIPLLFSIEKSCPNSDVSVYWEDIADNTKNIIKTAFSSFNFIETNFNFTNDVAKRISSKTIAWEFAAKQHKSIAEWILFLDADTLVIKDPLPLLDELDADIIITHRNESSFWINSGVLACKNKKNITAFFNEWCDETQRILDTPALFLQANDKKLPYGGADQMSLQKMIDYSTSRDTFVFQDLVIKSIHCRFLNETYSSPITNDTHILHYKGGWRDILFLGGYFTKLRTKKDSWEMYLMYITYFQQAILRINMALQTKLTTNDFHLIIPFYLNPATLKERFGLYTIFFIKSWIYSLPKRSIVFIREHSLF